MKIEEIDIHYKTGKINQNTIYHVVEVWNDERFYYCKNTSGDLYTIPIENIVFTCRKVKKNEGN